MLGVFVPAIVVAYLVGAIPFAQIIARMHGQDLRTVGSGNIGATNLARACGRRRGYTCFALDVLKGLVPMVAARAAAGSLPETDAATVGPGFLALWLAVGVAAILGHVFPVYLRFKGGKGVSTSFGVGLGLWPYFTVAALIALLVWLLCAATWRYVSLASICASITFPVTLAIAVAAKPDWPLATLWPLLIAATAIPLLVIVLHRQNIRRLLAGTESRIGGKKDRSI
ncbi:glycerol-3-phosphate 1-O-acyltransferase PlsY [Anaerobaca lacustris]|uniref:Glycerol-3-phosphate acyltransferase n=1 Tax=Anaerobaca lacustris TaxID=3044600 RepID=A0AAW6U1Y3_9BACT|nr:glycerol-3-phosphate 1-O-acyltransferase PlsY [Sedimentisphaerales bacterium M17dextr]